MLFRFYVIIHVFFKLPIVLILEWHRPYEIVSVNLILYDPTLKYPNVTINVHNSGVFKSMFVSNIDLKTPLLWTFMSAH